MLTSTSGSVLPPVSQQPPIPQQPPQSPFQPPNFGQVFSFFTGLGQNFQQTFGSGFQQPQELPGYLVNPNANAASNSPNTGAAIPPATGGNLILDLMNRAQTINSTSIAHAFRDRVDRIAGNNVVIMRLSNLLGQNRTRRQTEEAKPEEDAKPAVDVPAPEEPKPAEASSEAPPPPKSTETIDDVVKRLKDEREQNPTSSSSAPIPIPIPSPAPPAPSAQPPRGPTTFVGTVGQIPSDIFRGLDGLFGMGSMSGTGMTSLLDSVTRLVGKNGNVTIARSDSYNGALTMPDSENRARSLRDRFEERMAKHEQRRREWAQKFRERMDRRRDFGRENDDTVIKPNPEELPIRKPALTNPEPVAAL